MEGQQNNPILTLLEKHGTLIDSLTTDISEMSIDVLVLRAMVFGLMQHAQATGADLRPACMAIRDCLPKEHQAVFVTRLKTMYGIDLPD
ncbi:hypothetical protein ACFWQD_03410 [Alcaligenes faecalis]|uniref:hypothetical protein n=1 Tax=Alcaligenes faecalis TaxID=511 RepID=UPI0036642D9E